MPHRIEPAGIDLIVHDQWMIPVFGVVLRPALCPVTVAKFGRSAHHGSPRYAAASLRMRVFRPLALSSAGQFFSGTPVDEMPGVGSETSSFSVSITFLARNMSYCAVSDCG